MGLFSTTHHYHKRDNSTRIDFPDTIDVHEHKAPTDESVKLLNEFQEKALQNLIAKVDVKDNLVTGTVHAWGSIKTTMQDMIILIFKFQINGHEFVVKKEFNRYELFDKNEEIFNIQKVISDYAKSVMLWYALKMFVNVAYEQITGQQVPKYLLK